MGPDEIYPLVPALRVGMQLCPQGPPRRAWEPDESMGPDEIYPLVPTLRVGMQLCPQGPPRRAWEPDESMGAR